jgi:type IV pilus assembly protein PilW
MTSLRNRRQQGFSLIELLVALGINLVIVIAASYLYLGTSDAKRVLSQQQALNENGQYALDLIGRDIVNAGFYPAVRSTNPLAGSTTVGVVRVQPDGYTNVVAGTPAAYNSGVFGCAGQTFNTATDVCGAHTSAAVTADTIVINYFTNDAMGADVGQGFDCTRADVAGATENSARKDNTAGLVPKAPLFVSNRYTLATTTFSIENQTIGTFSLTCNGNRGLAYQPSIAGIEQLQFRYGVFTDSTTLQPSRFYAADAMAALGSINVGGVSKDAWARVVAVEVCLVARGLQASKLRGASNAILPYVNCAGTSVTPTDTLARRTYRKIFALRNNLTQTIAPPTQ